MYSEINFHMAGSEQHFILVTGYINDEGPYNFSLDTGASTTLISSALAQNLEIANRETKEAMGAGGKIKVEIGTIRALSIGQTRQENIQAVITNELQKISNCCNTRIDVNVGYNFLKHYSVSIDYQNRSLILAKENNKVPDKFTDAQVKIKFELAHPAKPLVLAPVFVNGKGPFQFVIDTGASITMLSKKIAQSLGLSTNDTFDVVGVGGMTQASQFRAESLAIGTFKRQNLKIMVSEFVDRLHQIVGKKLDGIVGFNFLREYKVTFDYLNEELILQ